MRRIPTTTQLEASSSELSAPRITTAWKPTDAPWAGRADFAAKNKEWAQSNACRNCGGAHVTSKCPAKRADGTKWFHTHVPMPMSDPSSAPAAIVGAAVSDSAAFPATPSSGPTPPAAQRGIMQDPADGETIPHDADAPMQPQNSLDADTFCALAV